MRRIGNIGLIKGWKFGWPFTCVKKWRNFKSIFFFFLFGGIFQHLLVHFSFFPWLFKALLWFPDFPFGFHIFLCFFYFSIVDALASFYSFFQSFHVWNLLLLEYVHYLFQQVFKLFVVWNKFSDGRVLLILGVFYCYHSFGEQCSWTIFSKM